MKTKFLVIAVMLIALPLLYNNCGQSTISASKMLRTSASDSIDVVTTNQAPKINCSIVNAANTSEVFKTLSSNSSGDVAVADPKDNNDLRFDCAATTDESATSSLQFFVDTDYDANSPSWQPLADMRLAATLRRPMAIRAVDPQGKASVKSFNLEVDCAVATPPSVSGVTLSVTPLARVNHFRVVVNGAAGLQYAYDFNGDGDFDPLDPGSFNVWTNQSSIADVYIANGGANGEIVARLKNNCGAEAEVRQAVNLNVRSLALAAPAAPLDHWYIEGTISGINTANAHRSSNDTAVTMYPDERDEDRMDCDFNKNGSLATFKIAGNNYYQDSNDYTGSEGAYEHGLSLQVVNIPDSGADGLQQFTVSNGIRVNAAQYAVSTVDETPTQALLNERFNKDGNFDVTLNMIRATAEIPCSDGSSVQSVAIQIYGSYSGPMRSTSGRTVTVSNGKYFCEWAMADSCVGGQGQGGGEPPPPQ